MLRSACRSLDHGRAFLVADLRSMENFPSAQDFGTELSAGKRVFRRSAARRVVLHIIAETSQHAGHADIVREALDGSKTMG